MVLSYSKWLSCLSWNLCVALHPALLYTLVYTLVRTLLHALLHTLVNTLWCTLWCKLSGAHCSAHFGANFGAHSGAHSIAQSWRIVEVEVGAAFRPSQARPKSTPSVFLILNPAPAPTLNIRGCTHSQWPPHVSLNPALRPPSRTFSATSLQPAHMITRQPYMAWPPPFIYTLCSASMCAPICQQAGALLMALVASLFAAHSSGQELISSCCAVLAFIFVFPTFCLNYYSVCTTTV